MNAAREGAGLPILRSKWTRERVVREIRELAGASPSPILRAAGDRLFGWWRAAVAAASRSAG